ncbi:MAG: DUF262 domain-containing protein [Clostridia bacterium]|nr:DUF262 domain-containing protein [Clostridia bacterium]
MEVKPFQVSVREIFDGYLNDEESGQVVAFGGKLNVRPAYQREFVYNAEQQEAVMHTILNDFPLNVIYWSDNGDGTYEMIDGQQRTLSFCEWLNNGFSIFANPNAPKMPYYAHTSEVIKERVLNYKLMVYICKGTDVEKLEWFKVINIAGEKLNDQELRNAVYTGQWLADAKQFFSKRNCIAYKLGEKYLTGSPIRQEYLESVLYWISSAIGLTIEELMARHQGDASATPLKDYYRGMINWIEQTFPNYRKLMRGIEWGLLFNDFGFRTYNPEELEKQISELLLDEDVTRQKGIYEYVLSGKTREKALSIRQFSENDRRRMYERQQGICPLCEKEGRGVKLELSEMHADHKIPWSRGGHTTLENGWLLCRRHNLEKSDK